MRRVKLYYSISEVAEITKLQPYTLRSWEKEFSCLRPRRIHGKNRSYRERDIGIVILIKRLLHDERYTTQGASKKLKSEPELLRNLEGETAFLHADANPKARGNGIPKSSTSSSAYQVEPATSAPTKIDGAAQSSMPVQIPPAERAKQMDPVNSTDVAALRELIAGTRRALHELLQIL